tara:strand:+ start:3476 stop:4615 length:1140 start_codon:yes stop_codon:yes gene_type:complete
MKEKAKSNEPIKQEGEFKVKKKTPKKLVDSTEGITKVSIKEPLVEVPAEITKVVIPAEEVKADEPVQIGEIEEVENFIPIKEVTEEKIAEVKAEVKEALRDEKVLGKALPENIEKLVSFMEDTGGTIEDYTRLNADYSSVDDVTLLKEYYKQEKPYLEGEDIESILEDFIYDEDMDEAREIRKKKVAFKEEVAKAKSYLEETKSKYYDEIKLRPGVTQDQQKATDFFNRYTKQQEQATQKHAQFQESTKQLFDDNFEGFDIKVGDKSYKYNIQNRDKIAENQSNINNLVGKFLDADGNISDTKGYHKAMYAADNVDKIASHFYEQGKADAVKDVLNKSKNLTSTKARTQQGDVFVGGFKVKAMSGLDSTKLKIKTKKFN